MLEWLLGCWYVIVVKNSHNKRKKSEKQSGLEMTSVWTFEVDEELVGKVATRLGTREKMPLSLLSFVATIESEILFSSGLSRASSKTCKK